MIDLNKAAILAAILAGITFVIGAILGKFFL
jgi:hypothetical protein